MTILDFKSEIEYMEEMGIIEKPKTEFRLYAFAHSWLSGIQKGIQTAHMVQEMNNKYLPIYNIQGNLVKKWATEFKTLILLEGGSSQNLNRLADMFEHSKYPSAVFLEDAESLNSSITCVGIIVPHDGTDVRGDIVDGNIVSAIRAGKLAC